MTTKQTEKLESTQMAPQTTPATLDTTSKEVAAVPDAAPPALIGDDGWGDVGDGDLAPDDASSIPFLPLNRKVDGGFTDPFTGDTTDTVEFIWGARSKSRAWWAEGFSGASEKAPGCRSFDGLVPDPNSPDLQNGGKPCATCIHAQWPAKGTPACKESIEALAFLYDRDQHAFQIARLRFGGLAFSRARDYWNNFKLRMPRKPAIAFLTRATLEKVDTDNGVFLAPHFEVVDELARSQADPIIAERDRRLEEWKAAVATDVATQTKADVVDDDGTVAQTAPAREGVDEEPF